jgi:2-keto-3-deoxy-L-rhamnonate aldolase RhmA
MDLNRNSFKHAIAAGKLQIGLWCSLCSNIAADVVGDSGFDWLLLDTEHSPNEIPDLVGQLQAVSGGAATPIVRPAWNDTVLIKRCLDIGAQTLLVPYVQNAEEARRAVEAVRYPPRGMRGVAVASRASRYGRVTDYLKKADAEICLLVQVETRSALDQLEAIAAVDGVDVLFVGPNDLSHGMGIPGRFDDPRYLDALAAVAAASRAAGKVAGVMLRSTDEVEPHLRLGYSFFALSTDAGLLGRTMRSAVATMRAVG